MKLAAAPIILALVQINACQSCVLDMQGAGRASTDQGTLHSEQEDGVLVWRGIPYASAERFGVPSPARTSGLRYRADEFGAACPSKDGESTTESCLTLNIWSPDDEGSYPVLVWFHGGAFEFGSSSDTFEADGQEFDTFDGGELVQTMNAVVVTVNYRLGPFGFLAHPAIDDTAGGNPGSFGLMDMVESLRWLEENVSEFGGDPDRVTIFGESAGGIAACHLLTAEGVDGLFDRAILQSGACTPFTRDVVGAHEIGETFADVLIASSSYADCVDARDAAATLSDVEDCLRNAPRADLVAAMRDPSVNTFRLYDVNSVPWAPPAGTALLPDFAARRFAAGEFVRVPVLAGNTSDELGYFRPRPIGDDCAAENLQELRGSSPPQARDLADLFAAGHSLPMSPTPEEWDAEQTQLLAAAEWDCATEHMLELMHAAGQRDLWRFEFDHLGDWQDDPTTTFLFRLLCDGAGVRTAPFVFNQTPTPSHGTDVAFTFGHPEIPERGADLEDQALSFAMRHTWIAFAWDGDLEDAVVAGDATPWAPGTRAFVRFDELPHAVDEAVGADDLCGQVGDILGWDCAPSCTPGTDCPVWCGPPRTP